jgi:hypothetical protein
LSTWLKLQLNILQIDIGDTIVALKQGSHSPLNPKPEGRRSSLGRICRKRIRHLRSAEDPVGEYPGKIYLPHYVRPEELKIDPGKIPEDALGCKHIFWPGMNNLAQYV